MNRRTVLGLLGSTAVVAAVGAGAYVVSRKPAVALEPWDAAGSHDNPRLFALSYAILAPNPHNRQPWIFELDGDDTIRLYCDLNRRLPETDPYDRQIVVGFGCVLHLLEMVAAEAGFATKTVAFPEGEPAPRLDERPLAQVTFVETDAPGRDPLFAAVPHRRTNREPFDTDRPVAADRVSRLIEAARHPGAAGTVDPDRIAALRDLTWRAFETEIRTPAAYQESIDLMRIGAAEIDADPDGISLSGPLNEALRLAGVLNRKSLADPASQAFKQGLKMYRPIIDTAQGHVWIVSGPGRAAELEAGRAWLRLNLAATAMGIALQPLSQALQEYPEQADLYHEVHEMLAVESPRKIQMLGRIGYGPDTGPSPRWPLSRHMREP